MTKETLKLGVVYFLVGWIVEFIMASKDTSVCIDDRTLSFTFRTWIWVDGGTMLGFLVAGAFIAILVNQLYWPFLILYTLFKISWIIVGFVMFMKLDFSLCSDLIISFGVAYFATVFLWFQLYFISASFKKLKEQ